MRGSAAFPAAAPSGPWSERARAMVLAALQESGALGRRDAPLFVASSSVNVGDLEAGAPFLPDCMDFVEQVAGWLDWRGPVHWVNTACTSALVACLSPHRLVSNGEADDAVVLGLELGNRFTLAGFEGMQLLDPEAPRPLAVARRGLVIGEAAAVLWLGAAPGRWSLLGGANRVDGSNPAGASRSAITAMVRQALSVAGLAAHDIDLIKLQAAGSPQNDSEELAGLGAVFDPLPTVLTLKHRLGHTLGASGCAELALLTASLEAGQWPWAAGLEPDPAFGLPPLHQPPARARHLLASILGFGGGHACTLWQDTAA